MGIINQPLEIKWTWTLLISFQNLACKWNFILFFKKSIWGFLYTKRNQFYFKYVILTTYWVDKQQLSIAIKCQTVILLSRSIYGNFWGEIGNPLKFLLQIYLSAFHTWWSDSKETDDTLETCPLSRQTKSQWEFVHTCRGNKQFFYWSNLQEWHFQGRQY